MVDVSLLSFQHSKVKVISALWACKLLLWCLTKFHKVNSFYSGSCWYNSFQDIEDHRCSAKALHPWLLYTEIPPDFFNHFCSVVVKVYKFISICETMLLNPSTISSSIFFHLLLYLLQLVVGGLHCQNRGILTNLMKASRKKNHEISLFQTVCNQIKVKLNIRKGTIYIFYNPSVISHAHILHIVFVTASLANQSNPKQNLLTS